MSYNLLVLFSNRKGLLANSFLDVTRAKKKISLWSKNSTNCPYQLHNQELQEER